jgi:hypothetical protein
VYFFYLIYPYFRKYERMLSIVHNQSTHLEKICLKVQKRALECITDSTSTFSTIINESSFYNKNIHKQLKHDTFKKSNKSKPSNLFSTTCIFTTTKITQKLTVEIKKLQSIQILPLLLQRMKNTILLPNLIKNSHL